MNSARRNLVIVITILLAIAIFGSVWSYYNQQRGTITLTYSSPPSPRGVNIRFNNKNINPTNGSTYTLHKGSYRLTITKTGYKTFTTNFVMKTGQSLAVNINLVLNSDPTITNIRQIVIPGINYNTVSIVNIQYFYNKNWAFVRINSALSGNASLVVSYNAVTKKWHTELGPGTLFTQISINGLPAAVRNYFISNNYVTS